jgi:hypothetical protein
LTPAPQGATRRTAPKHELSLLLTAPSLGVNCRGHRATRASWAKGRGGLGYGGTREAEVAKAR